MDCPLVLAERRHFPSNNMDIRKLLETMRFRGRPVAKLWRISGSNPTNPEMTGCLGHENR